MCCKILLSSMICIYLVVYVLGATLYGVTILLHAYEGKKPNNPDIQKSTEQILKLLGLSLVCYSIPYHIVCHTAMLTGRAKYISKHPIMSALSLIVSFGMIIGLSVLLIYTDMSLGGFLGSCFIGVLFGGIFLLLVMEMRREATLKKQKEERINMEEGVKKTSGFTSYIGEAEMMGDEV